MSEEETRSFKITGEAAKAYASAGMKKKRVTRKRGGEEEDIVANVTNNAGTANNVGTANNAGTATPVINLPNITAVPVSIPAANNMRQVVSNTAVPTTISRQNGPSVPPPYVVQDGGDDKKIKVELKKKQATKKVQLHPKKDGPQKVATAKKSETRKKNRKVLLGVASLHKRMTRAKKMHKKVKEMPLDKLREELISKKLIKSTSKAPESILRQIATDAQIVDSKSL
jgi:hypothetical protein